MDQFLPTPRSFLRLTGSGAFDLLQGTLTQDLRLLAASPLLYACHLTPQGKLLTDLFLFQEKDTFILDVSAPHMMPLAQSLHRYCVGLEVSFEDISEDLFLTLDPTHTTGAPDPRHPELPFRHYSHTPPASPSSLAALHRVPLGIAEPTEDFPNCKLFPAELGLDLLQGVSYTKGCYVGQEVTTRLYRRSTPKKAVYLLDTSFAPPVETPVVTETGTQAGWTGFHAHGVTLALLQKRHPEKPLFVDGHPVTARLSPLYQK